MPDLRYPIGPFVLGAAPDASERVRLLSDLVEVPDRLRTAVAGLSGGQLDTPYRPGGWSVRQVVHHLADAQMNWYIRTRLALTEDGPVVKAYDEARWAELADARTAPLELSLILLDALHRRWVELFRRLSEEQWKRRMVHPDRGVFILDATLPMHVWHARHHTAHVTELRRRLSW